MTTRSSRSGGNASRTAKEKAAAPAPAEQQKQASSPLSNDEEQAKAKAKAEVEQAAQTAQEQVPADATDAVEGDGEPAADTPPEEVATDGGNAAGPGPTVGQQAEMHDTLPTQGTPVPAEVDRGMVLPETGLSPAAFTGGQPATAATDYDPERNGKPLSVGTDTTGELRRVEGAVPTAAHGRAEGNGLATNMIAAQTSREAGGNGAPAAQLVGSGVRGENGVGTLDAAPDVELPQYPSTLLTRSSSEAAPVEPPDVTHVTEPKLGYVETSTDPIAAAAAVQSHVGDVTVKLVGPDGSEVKPSEFFEVPDDPRARTLRIVKHRVSEVFTVRQVKTPSRRLLFTAGQEVPVQMANTLIELHG